MASEVCEGVWTSSPLARRAPLEERNYIALPKFVASILMQVCFICLELRSGPALCLSLEKFSINSCGKFGFERKDSGWGY